MTDLGMASDTTAVAPVQDTALPAVSAPSASSSQQFSVQADTLDVEHQKKTTGSGSTSVSVKASVPKKFYTVEVGAFRDPANVKRHQDLLTQRFKLPVRTEFDSTIHLTRVTIGTFSSREQAVQFMDTMKKEFPKEYIDIWVSSWAK